MFRVWGILRVSGVKGCWCLGLRVFGAQGPNPKRNSFCVQCGFSLGFLGCSGSSGFGFGGLGLRVWGSGFTWFEFENSGRVSVGGLKTDLGIQESQY